MRIRPCVAVVCFAAACAPTRSSAPARPEDPALAARVEAVRLKHGVPGMGAARVAADGTVVVAVAGRRRVDREAPLRGDDRFHLGSDTKAMTASLVARLVDRGVLRFDQTLGELLGDALPIADAYRGVTVRMLLRHLSGVPADVAFTPDFLADFDEGWTVPQQRAWLARKLLAAPPASPPGERFTYSNYNYLIVGHLLERATGQPWEALMEREVFAPLGMSGGCGFGPTSTGAHPDGSWAHEVRDGAYVPSERDSSALIGPAGTVHCTLAAWARFAAAHARPEDGAWISTASMRALHAPVPAAGLQEGWDVGAGWVVTRTDPPTLRHSGSNGRNVALAVIVPARRLAVLVTVNAGDERAFAAARELSDALVEEALAAGR